MDSTIIINFLTMVFVLVTAIATTILAIPVINSGRLFWKKFQWKREIKSRPGENEDDQKIGYIAEKAIEHFVPLYNTHLVQGRMSFDAINESREQEGNPKLNSKGDVLTIKLKYFKRFVRELLKDYDEEQFIEAFLSSKEIEVLGYFDGTYIHTYFDFHKDNKNLIDLYTEPIVIGPADTMRSVYI